jgi:hypothetical protein
LFASLGHEICEVIGEEAKKDLEETAENFSHKFANEISFAMQEVEV